MSVLVAGSHLLLSCLGFSSASYLKVHVKTHHGVPLPQVSRHPEPIPNGGAAFHSARTYGIKGKRLPALHFPSLGVGLGLVGCWAWEGRKEGERLGGGARLCLYCCGGGWRVQGLPAWRKAASQGMGRAVQDQDEACRAEGSAPAEPPKQRGSCLLSQPSQGCTALEAGGSTSSLGGRPLSASCGSRFPGCQFLSAVRFYFHFPPEDSWRHSLPPVAWRGLGEAGFC